MIYLQTKEGPTIVVLETANLEKMKAGNPAVTPDKLICIGWTPDMPWLAEQLQKLFEKGDPDGAEVGKLIDESTKRPENPTPPRKDAS